MGDRSALMSDAEESEVTSSVLVLVPSFTFVAVYAAGRRSGDGVERTHLSAERKIA